MSTQRPAEHADGGGVAADAVAAGEGERERAPQQRRPPRPRAYVPGGAEGWGAAGEEMPDLQLAAELALTCYELYRRTPAGLAPEIAHFANNTGAGAGRRWWAGREGARQRGSAAVLAARGPAARALACLRVQARMPSGAPTRSSSLALLIDRL